MSDNGLIISAENVTKRFTQGQRNVVAVDAANIEIRKGERVYIHGPSGAGKSTLLQMLGGLSKPSSGRISFGAKDMYRLSDRARSAARNKGIGFIFQFYHLLPELSVLENVMLPARIRGKESGREIKERAVSLLEQVRMPHRLSHKPREISGGEAQRVAIARGLINSPDMLFCDEPTGNLDSAMSAEIYGLILSISRDKGMSVLVVSHQGVVDGFYTSEYHMKDGKLKNENITGR
jgi:ABC-type lipoprotein export system ATPase subunit